MKPPVYPRGANPRVDRPILRKSFTYCEDQVARGNADWVDTQDPLKGIVCRELLERGPLSELAEPPVPTSLLALAEIPGVRFVPPATAKTEDRSILRWRLHEARLIAALAV